jgi:hypothetical protein
VKDKKKQEQLWLETACLAPASLMVNSDNTEQFLKMLRHLEKALTHPARISAMRLKMNYVNGPIAQG